LPRFATLCSVCLSNSRITWLMRCAPFLFMFMWSSVLGSWRMAPTKWFVVFLCFKHVLQRSSFTLLHQVVVIPFCQRLEIGPHISPTSRSLFYELREDKVEPMTSFVSFTSHILQIKEKFKSGMDVKLTYTIANSLGVSRQTSVIEDKVVWAIVLNNIPQYLDPPPVYFPISKPRNCN
jgi:hypothetical protein